MTCRRKTKSERELVADIYKIFGIFCDKNYDLDKGGCKNCELDFESEESCEIQYLKMLLGKGD